MKYQLVILLLFSNNLFSQNYIAQWTSSIHDIYEVQQSTDGAAWKTIGSVSGSIEEKTYQYIVPGAGYFYRIKAGDVNSISIWLEPVILPVSITSASVKASTLTWNVSNEDGIDYYLIESSTDGIDFKEISKVKATGSNIYKMSLK